MTKREIQAELKKYGIDVTLRPRKSTLVELLERTKKTKSCCGYYDRECEFSEMVFDSCSISPLTPWYQYVAIGLFILSLLVLLPI